MRSAAAFGVFAALASTVVSSPLSSRQSFGYILTAAAADDNIDGELINANGQEFWIGKETKTSCVSPSPGSNACGGFPNITTLDFFAETESAGMYANVPGGQDVYVKANGALSFTDPHEEGVYPEGAFTTGFVQVHQGTSYRVEFNNVNASSTGWYTCGEETPFQIFATIKGVADACEKSPISLGIVLTQTSDLGAYQYE